MELLWVGLALMGGTLQVVRNGASRALTGEMSVHGVNLVRFLFALPFALGVMALLWIGHRTPGDPGTVGVLLALAEERGLALGMERLGLEVREGNLPAVRLYEKAGYLPKGKREGYYADGSQARVMEKTLA